MIIEFSPLILLPLRLTHFASTCLDSYAPGGTIGGGRRQVHMTEFAGLITVIVTMYHIEEADG